MKTYYLHTIDHIPAYFDGEQIVYSMRGGYVRCGQWLCESLAEIRSNEAASRLFRKRNELLDQGKIGYVRVHVRKEAER